MHLVPCDYPFPILDLDEVGIARGAEPAFVVTAGHLHFCGGYALDSFNAELQSFSFSKVGSLFDRRLELIKQFEEHRNGVFAKHCEEIRRCLLLLPRSIVKELVTERGFCDVESLNVRYRIVVWRRRSLFSSATH